MFEAMPKFKFEEIEQQLSKGRLFPLYLIYGPEQYIIKIIVDKIKSVYQAETGAEVDRFAARGLDAVKVIDSLKTLPMWSKGRLIIIDNADKLSAKSKELMQSYAESPSDSAVLVLVSEKFDGRSKLYKALNKNGALCQIKVIYESQMPFWINRECRKHNRNISHEAAHFMTELVGTDLSAMAGAIEKIILFIGSKKIIDLKDVETVLSDTSQKSIFDLTNAVGAKDLSRAEDRLLNLLRNNESPVVVVNMLARHWRLLLRAKELMGSRYASERDIASKLGVHPFFVKEYIFQSKKFEVRQLSEGLQTLWRSDVAVKSSRLPKDAVLHKLVIDLINSGS